MSHLEFGVWCLVRTAGTGCSPVEGCCAVVGSELERWLRVAGRKMGLAWRALAYVALLRCRQLPDVSHLWRSREADIQRERERETDRQTDRERERDREREIYIHRERERERFPDTRETSRNAKERLPPHTAPPTKLSPLLLSSYTKVYSVICDSGSVPE